MRTSHSGEGIKLNKTLHDRREARDSPFIESKGGIFHNLLERARELVLEATTRWYLLECSAAVPAEPRSSPMEIIDCHI